MPLLLTCAPRCISPIQWHEWGDDAFDKAQRENKPMLLDIGAVWCHWCHVMDRESYENPEIAHIINERFVAVKVDRDERPDVDSRYQAAVQAISGQGGWPLTAFLTPDGRPFFGGTYFPPEDHYGRPSFKRVLLTIADAFHEKNGDVMEQAKMVMAAIAQAESFAGRSGEFSPQVIDAIVKSALEHVRRASRRLRDCTEVSASFRSRSADRSLCPHRRRRAAMDVVDHHA